MDWTPAAAQQNSSSSSSAQVSFPPARAVVDTVLRLYWVRGHVAEQQEQVCVCACLCVLSGV